MAVISVAKYQTIAQLYANAQKQLTGITDYYYDAAYEIVILSAFDPELDLLQPFYSAYLSSQTVFLQPPAAVVAAVIALQQHVLDKARSDPNIDPDNTADRFQDINDWIDAAATNGSATTATGRQNDVDTSFKVPDEFASLSSRAGYIIDDENINALL